MRISGSSIKNDSAADSIAFSTLLELVSSFLFLSAQLSAVGINKLADFAFTQLPASVYCRSFQRAT